MKMNCKAPIIIGGCEGSGTTMLVQTLNRHKNIAGYDETQLVRVLRSLDEQLFGNNSDTFSRYLSRFTSKEELLASIRAFIDGILLKKVVDEGKQRWAEKSPANCYYWLLWKKIFPEAKLIQVIRDGRDVVSSGMSYNYYSFEAGVKTWVRAIEQSRQVSTVFDRGHYLEVKFEDLVSRTERTMRSIIEFVEDEWDPAILELEKSPKFVRKWGANARAESPVRRWETDSSFNKDVFKETAGKTLIELGYEKDNAW
jgi:hypothetical protein